MCGITGYLDWRGMAATLTGLIDQMTHLLAHRGPDGMGTRRFDYVALGQTRLAIVDLPGGGQPMTLARGIDELAVVFCGEIYNHADLRAELVAAGRKFRTDHSDTEVILHAYEHWGVEAFARFDGMFALAIWDSRTESLFLVRDHVGEKPLYYYTTDYGMVFASEKQALLAHPQVPAELDEQGLNEIFAMMPMTTPGAGILRGVNEVKPAHWIRFTRTSTNERQYWRLVAAPHTDDLDTTKARVRDLYNRSTALRMGGDRPIAAMLSGGIDSSATAATAAKFAASMGQRLHTFAIDYRADDGVAYNASSLHVDSDAPWAELVAKHIGSVHHRVEVSTDEVIAAIPEMRRSMGGPSLPHVNAPLVVLCRAVSEFAPVVISGEAADEVFRGYAWHQNPVLFAHDGFPWDSTYPPPMHLLSSEARHQLRPQQYRADRYHEALERVPLLPGLTGLDRRRQEVTFLTIEFYLRFLFARLDFASMRSAVEPRAPFADPKLLQYVYNVPWDMLNTGEPQQPKGLLREAVGRDLLPQPVVDRVKSGFPVAQSRRATDEMWTMANDILSTPSAPIHRFIEPAAVRKTMQTSTLGDWASLLHVGAAVVDLNGWMADAGVRVC